MKSDLVHSAYAITERKKHAQEHKQVMHINVRI